MENNGNYYGKPFITFEVRMCKVHDLLLIMCMHVDTYSTTQKYKVILLVFTMIYAKTVNIPLL